MLKSEERIVRAVSSKLKWGDIGIIAERCELSREYVGRVLNVNKPAYNEEVIIAAKELIRERKMERADLLKEIKDL